MKTRIITAAVLVPVLLIVVLALPKIVMALVLSAFCGIAAYELLHSTDLVRNIRLLTYTMITAAMVPMWCYFGCPHAWGLLGALLFIVLLFAEMMASNGKLHFDKISLCMTAGLLIPYLFSAMVRIHCTELGRYLIMIPCILAFIPDSGAYFAGCFFGKHKLAPTISPKKTIEGAVGGVLTAVLGMLLYAFILDAAFGRTVSYGYALVFGVVVSLGDIFGDLMFSVIKRQTGIKDYGKLFPGHGGVLDRFDSMIVVAPLTEALLILLPMVV